MTLHLIGRHSNAVRNQKVQAAITALDRDGRFNAFAIGKIRHIKHRRKPGTIEVRGLVASGTRLVLYGRDVIVEGVGR
jgi:hypothetical protein